MRTKAITMQEIAEKAGVSITTVSHVVNKTRHVTKETRDAVLKIMDEENYQKVSLKIKPKNEYPNDAPLVLGIIMANLREDFYISVVKSVEMAVSEQEVSILLCDSEDNLLKESNNINYVLGRNICGLLIAPINSDPVPDALLETDIPIILLDRNFKDHRFTFVGIDNFRSAMTATSYLINKGCSHIVFLGYHEKVYTVKQRILGCKAALMELNKPPLKVLHLNFNNEDSFTLISNFLKENKIDGMVCCTTDLCFEAVAVVDALKLRVPEDLKIITFDENRWLDYLKYPISVVSQPTGEIGNFAIKKMMQYVKYPETRSDIKTEVLYDIQIIDRL